MKLDLGWFGRFKGTILNAEPGILEPATIRGKVTSYRITFEKRYESLWLSDEFGNLSSVPGQQSNTIYYAGKFMEKRSRITGVWTVLGESRWIDGMRWELSSISETWTATPSFE